MKNRTVVIFIIGIIVVGVVLGEIISRASGQEQRGLSREEQIQIMTESLVDAKSCFRSVYSFKDTDNVTRMAQTFFYYRTGMIPITQ